jgi:hypothetical protein
VTSKPCSLFCIIFEKELKQVNVLTFKHREDDRHVGVVRRAQRPGLHNQKEGAQVGVNQRLGSGVRAPGGLKAAVRNDKLIRGP